MQRNWGELCALPFFIQSSLKGILMKVEIKYEPKSLTEVVYSSAGQDIRINAYAQSSLNGHIILWGPNGTGKSTVAKLLPNAIAGTQAIIESKSLEDLLAVKDLKTYLMREAHSAKVLFGGKYFLVYDEADATKGSMSDFWTAVDYCGSDLMMILTTNNPMAIAQSVRSRSDEINFPALTPQQFLSRAQYILNAEGVDLPNAQVLHYLVQIQHTPDLRKYCRKVDELIYLVQNNLPLPPFASGAANQPQMKVVVGSK
jgi:replication-associated recombination protein RarA